MESKRGMSWVIFFALIVMEAAFAQAAWGQYNQPTLPGLGVAGPVNETQHNFADQSFVKTVLERDLGDLQLGKLAQDKSQSDDVKELGQKIIDTRSGMDKQFKLIAKSLGVPDPKGATKKDKQLIARLESLSGPQFDQEWIKALGKIHRQDIKDFQAESANAQEPSVKQVAQPDADVLSQELQEIQQVAQKHGVTLDDNR